jgi:hypothetical protein
MGGPLVYDRPEAIGTLFTHQIFTVGSVDLVR